MPEIVEIPIELTRFQLPQAVQERLQSLLDRQDEGYALSQAERQEAEGLVELAEFLSLLSASTGGVKAIANLPTGTSRCTTLRYSSASLRRRNRATAIDCRLGNCR